MNSENNKKVQDKKETKVNKKYINPFRMNILDDIYDPFDDLFGFENKMFKSFENIFNDIDLLSEKPKKEEKIPEKVEKMEEEPKEEEINTNTKVEEEIKTDKKEKEEEINTDKKVEEKEKKEEEKKCNEGSFYSKVYYSSYNNLNGEPHQESYQSQTIKQTNNGHNISETKEAYKNSNGVVKSAYQRNLDDKTTRFIKEKDLKTGKNNQKKVIKGIEEKDIDNFNKEYNEFSKKCGFKKNYHKLNTFNPFYPFGFNKKILSDGNSNIFLHKLLF